MTIIKIWTQCYRPFMMGGNVHAPIATKVEATGPFDLGLGFKGYVVVTPSGKTVVVEARSGGIVGNTVEQVKKDIESCGDAKAMEKQVVAACKEGETADVLDPAAFWKMYKD